MKTLLIRLEMPAQMDSNLLFIISTVLLLTCIVSLFYSNRRLRKALNDIVSQQNEINETFTRSFEIFNDHINQNSKFIMAIIQETPGIDTELLNSIVSDTYKPDTPAKVDINETKSEVSPSRKKLLEQIDEGWDPSKFSQSHSSNYSERD